MKVPLAFLFQSCHSSSISCSGVRSVKYLGCLPWMLPPSAPGKGAGWSILYPSFVPWALSWKRSLWPACTAPRQLQGAVWLAYCWCLVTKMQVCSCLSFLELTPQSPFECFAILGLIRRVMGQHLYAWLVTGGEEALLLRATLNCSKNHPSLRSV